MHTSDSVHTSEVCVGNPLGPPCHSQMPAHTALLARGHQSARLLLPQRRGTAIMRASCTAARHSGEDVVHVHTLPHTDADTWVQISDARPTPITPDGWAFSIWGIIFTGQAAAIIYLLIRRLKWQSDTVRPQRPCPCSPSARPDCLLCSNCESYWLELLLRNSRHVFRGLFNLLGTKPRVRCYATASPTATQHR